MLTMIKLDQNDIRDTLPRVKKGLDQYVDIQSRLHSVDVSEDVDFQRMFTAFYRVRRNKKWRTRFFSILQLAMISKRHLNRFTGKLAESKPLSPASSLQQ